MEYLEEQLTKNIRKYYSYEPVGLLYSGGLDSSIIAHILLSIFPPSLIIGVTVGVTSSYDLRNAITGAQILNLKLDTCLITKDNLLKTIEELKCMNIIQNISDLSIAIPMFLGMQTLAKNARIKNVFLGQGADELFGGYQKYLLSLCEYGDKITSKMMNDDFTSLIDHQIKLEREIANKFELIPVYPYINPQIVIYAQSQYISAHIISNSKGKFIRKAILRNLALNLGLPNEIVVQPKKAMQYGSGTINLLRKLVKSAGYNNINHWFNNNFQNISE